MGVGKGESETIHPTFQEGEIVSDFTPFNPFQKDMSQEVKNPEPDKRIKFPMHRDLQTSKFAEAAEPHIVVEQDAKEILDSHDKEITRLDILMQYGGIESNIPINSPYWQMKR